MKKFIIIEERRDTFSCVISAKSLEHAKRLYDEDSEKVFGDQWEHDEGVGCELTSIIELDDEGKSKVIHVFEEGKLADSFKGAKSHENNP